MPTTESAVPLRHGRSKLGVTVKCGRGFRENIKQIVLQHQRATPQPVPPIANWSSPDYGSPYHWESLYSSPDMFYRDCDDDYWSMDYS